MPLQGHKKYTAIFLFFTLLVLSLFIVRPLFTAIVGAIAIAILINPFYKALLKLLRSKGIAAFVASIVTILIAVLPVVLIINIVLREASGLYQQFSSLISLDHPIIESLLQTMEQFTGTNTNVRGLINQLFSWVFDVTQDIVISLPSKIIVVIVMAFLLYYFLKDQQAIIKYIKGLLPLSPKENEAMLERIRQVVQGVLYGTLLIAIIQGILSGIGYWLLGVPSPILLTILTTIFALIPFLGTGLVWIPASVYLFIIHLDDGFWWKGIVLAIYGTIVVSTIDNILRPKFIGDSAKVHPAIVLVGVVGGLWFFGTLGFLIGPLILALFFEFVNVYKNYL